jgi:hypothetical protein
MRSGRRGLRNGYIDREKPKQQRQAKESVHFGSLKKDRSSGGHFTLLAHQLAASCRGHALLGSFVVSCGVILSRQRAQQEGQ